ncbi:hypothetical protein CEUSTIGMA_g13751.t1 [Chlamydomonas eustigma]|uniref:Uncharacterized protein n=1 Tax=Chlamydomonas eustigma TaxID=1157962 RepID=A0A250XTP1_9CHLO|nr:hypothetical protein CEUSTIGMA_g13751.t1 [Chlamydomonas eustigma]|eukprot:GAX86339.1 hypothetical protein CEUSTIGMA_g13751.t1 [Chlamydomonas eustigma]
MMVPSGTRSEFVEELMKREKLLIQLYTSAFPPPQPLIPGDAAMDAVMAQEERHLQEVLQAARQAGQMTRPVSAATVSSTATASSKPVNLLEQRQQQLQLGIGNINNVTSTAGSVNNSTSAIQAGNRGGPPAGKEQFSSNGFGARAVVPAGFSSSTTNNQLRPASAVSKPRGWSLNTDVQLAEFLSGGGGSTRTPGASSVGAIASNSSSVLGTEGDGDTVVSNVQNNKPVVAGALSSWGRPVSAAAPSNRR